MFIRTQNIQSLNNPVHLAILLILVQTINKNFTHPFPSVNPPTYCISFNLVIEKLMIPTLMAIFRKVIDILVIEKLMIPTNNVWHLAVYLE